MFLIEYKSTLFLIITFTPLPAIKPYSTIVIPPITGSGILAINACRYPRNPKPIANIAANPITHTDPTFVKATTPVFSPSFIFS
jgi:hypothetical protein